MTPDHGPVNSPTAALCHYFILNFVSGVAIRAENEAWRAPAIGPGLGSATDAGHVEMLWHSGLGGNSVLVNL